MLLVVDYRTWRLALGYRIEGLGMKEGSGRAKADRLGLTWVQGLGGPRFFFYS